MIFLGAVMNQIKILCIAILISIANTAGAQLKYYGTYEFSQEENRVTDADNQKSGFVLGGKNAQGWDVSGKFDLGHESGSGNGLELRIRKHWTNAVGRLSPWLGVRGGETIKPDDHWLYYAVEGGVKFPIAGALSGDVGYRYRNATEQWREYETHRYYGMISYAISKQDSVGVRFASSTGDSKTDAWRLSYTRNF
jgi:opacity protein-like surface antigen